MLTEKQLKFVISAIQSAIAVIIFVAVITIAADLAPGLKGWLKNTFTHHWVGKSVLLLALFIVSSLGLFFFCPCKPDIEKLKKSLNILIWTSIISSAAIFLFFIWEAFLK